MSGQYFLDLLNLGVNSAFAALALWGLVSFWPNWSKRKELGPTYTLMLAIWIGFLGVGLNVLYWRVFGDIALYYGLIDLFTLRYYGAIGDMVWKTMGAASVFMHFYARWQALPDADRDKWPILLVAYYPDKSHRIYKYAMIAMRKVQEDEETSRKS